MGHFSIALVVVVVVGEVAAPSRLVCLVRVVNRAERTMMEAILDSCLGCGLRGPEGGEGEANKLPALSI